MHSHPRPGRAADGGQVGEDRVAVAAEAVDTLPEPFGLAFQWFRRLCGQALGGQVDPAREERQDPAIPVTTVLGGTGAAALPWVTLVFTVAALGTVGAARRTAFPPERREERGIPGRMALLPRA